MSRMSLLGLGLALALMGPRSSRAAESDAKACEALGFTDTLVCAQCDKMAEFIQDEKLINECKGCCIEEAKDDSTFARGVLEVCN